MILFYYDLNYMVLAIWCRHGKFTVNLSSTTKTFFISTIISWHPLL